MHIIKDAYSKDITQQIFWFYITMILKKKLVFVDIGELGWSLYLSGHVNWLKKNTNKKIAVFTSRHRKALFENADEVKDIPDEFYRKYSQYSQVSFGLDGVGREELKRFFRHYLPEGRFIPGYFEFCCSWICRAMTLFTPYKVKNKSIVGNILVFPRCRIPMRNWSRNLPLGFYQELIATLCNEFPDRTVIAMGSKEGAYSIDLPIQNYRNFVGKDTTIQDLIDFCPACLGAVGGASAPPKITLLQGVPTYVIGHEKERVIIKENWLHTKVGFWEIPSNGYETFNDKDCIIDIVRFLKSEGYINMKNRQ